MIVRASPVLLLAVLVACSSGEQGEPGSTTSSSSSGSASSSSSSASSSASSGATSSSSGGSSAASSSSSSSGSGGCTAPLDEQTLADLTISAAAFGNFQLPAGGTVDLSVGVVACCYSFEAVDACATWSITPTDGASISADNGVLTVAADTPSGTGFVVRADIEDGRRVLEATLSIFTPEANPLVATRTEVAQLDCDTGAEVEPEEIIGELVFRANGTFGVTWTPFEIYYDYWGTYTFDLPSGALTLTVDGGNYVPPDVDGTGTFEIDDEGRLILRDIWLGMPSGATQAARCGHVFN